MACYAIYKGNQFPKEDLSALHNHIMQEYPMYFTEQKASQAEIEAVNKHNNSIDKKIKSVTLKHNKGILDLNKKRDTLLKDIEDLKSKKDKVSKDLLSDKKRQKTELDKEILSKTNAFNKEIKDLQEQKKSITITNTKSETDGKKEEERQKVLTEKEVPATKKAGTSIKQKLVDYFNNLFGKNVIEISDEKLLEIAKANGFDSFRAMVQAWHGSKANFNKFSLDFIGEGEGNWEFGWGAYFSSLKDIASGYGNLALRGANRLPIKVLGNDKIHNYYVSMTPKGAKYYKEHIATYETKSVSQKEFETNVKGKADRYLYEANIEDNFIDYNDKVGEEFALNVGLGVESTDTGWQAYTKIAKSFDKIGRYAGYKEASLYLLGKGYNGIKYPAESISQGKTSDTARGFNYVVFDENAITIEEKIRFLATPQGEIYGLYDRNTGKIYLSKDFSNKTTIEEVKHLQYHLMKEAAKSGDKEAERILKSADKILSPIVDKAVKALGEGKEGVSKVRFMSMPNGEKVTVKEVSPEIVNGFYSNTEKALLDIPQEKMTGAKWKQQLLSRGAKSEEMKWTTLSDYLDKNKDKSISKQNIEKYLKDNRIEIVEVVKGDNLPPTGVIKKRQDLVDEALELGYVFNWYSTRDTYPTVTTTEGRKVYEDELPAKIADLADAAQKLTPAVNRAPIQSTSFSQYQQSGDKSDYKEVLITMPISEYDFKSSHYDEPNILVHVRMNTRTDAEGKKVLFLEEIQSDWGEMGKKEGFNKGLQDKSKWRAEYSGKFEDYYNKHKIYDANGVFIKEAISDPSLSKEEIINENYKAFPKGSDKLPPTAPFVTDTNSWTKLGLKYALRHAVESGADKLVWTTGEQQNERYDLSKEVDYIQYEDAFGGRKYVDISTPTGLITFKVEPDGKIIENKNTPMPDAMGKNIADVIGKDISEKILSDKKSSGRLEGEGLKVGGKGMIGFYGSPTEGKEGIVGGVAKALVKELTGKQGEIVETKIDTGVKGKFVDELNEKQSTIDEINQRQQQIEDELKSGKGDDNELANEYNRIQNDKQQLEQEISDLKRRTSENLRTDNRGKLYLQSPQHSIDITPELKAKVKAGIPRFAVGKETSTNKELNELLGEYGIDLRSDVYQQAQNESPDEYRDRIFDEVWAKLTAQEGATLLDNPTLWKKIKDLLVDLQKWFADKLGLKGTDLENLTPQQLGKQSLSSLIKGEYLPVAEEKQESPKTTDAIIRVKNIQEVYDRIPKEVRDYIENILKKDIKDISVTALKLLAHPQLSVTDKLAYLGEGNALRKQGMSDEKINDMVNKIMEDFITYEDHEGAVKNLINRYWGASGNKDLMIGRDTQVDVIVLSGLYFYFYNNRRGKSSEYMSQIAEILKDISSISGANLSVFNANRNLGVLTGFILIESHGNVFRQLGKSDGNRTAQELIKKLQEQIKFNEEEVKKIRIELEKAITDSKKTNKNEGLRGGFRANPKAIQEKVDNLVSMVNTVGSFSVENTITNPNILFSAEKISEVEQGLVDLMTACYQKAKGDILQTKLLYEDALNKLKDVQGVNVYDKLLLKLPAGFDFVRDTMMSNSYKKTIKLINEEAAVNTINNRVLGDKNMKGLGSRTTFDYIDNFIKELFNRVNPIVGLKLDTIDTEAFQIPTSPSNLTKPERVAYDYKLEADELVKDYHKGNLTIHELEKGIEKINKEMEKALSSFIDFKDYFPKFVVNYGSTPVEGSVVRHNNNLYLFDGNKWNRQGDLRKVEDKTQRQLTSAYASKISTPTYVKVSYDRFNEFLAENSSKENKDKIATLLTQAYRDFTKKGYGLSTIKKIEDFIYAGFNVDVNDVQLRHMVETDLALQNQVLSEIVIDSFGDGSKGGTHARLAQDLMDRLGLTEYDAKVAEEKIKALIDREIAPTKLKYLQSFEKDSKVIKGALKLIVDGKMSDLDLLPIFAKKFDIEFTDPKTVEEFNYLADQLRNAETVADKNKASNNLLQFFVNHKQETIIRKYGTVLMESIYGSMFGLSTVLNAASSIWLGAMDIIGTEGKIVTDLVSFKKGSTSWKEFKHLHRIAWKAGVKAVMEKGIPEIMYTILTMESSSSYLAVEPRLTRDSILKRKLITETNAYFRDLFNFVKDVALGDYKSKTAQIYHTATDVDGTLKEMAMDIDKFHPLYNFREVFAMHRNSSTMIDDVLEELTEKEDFLKENSLGVGVKAKLKDIASAKSFIEGNRGNITKVRLYSDAEIMKKGGKELLTLVLYSVRLFYGMIYRALALPLLGDIMIRAFMTNHNVVIDTYNQLLIQDPSTRDFVSELNKALGNTAEVEAQMAEEGYKKIIPFKTKVPNKSATGLRLANPADWIKYNTRKQEVISNNTDETLWSVAEREARVYGMMNKPYGYTGYLSNCIMYFLNNSSLLNYGSDATNSEKVIKDIAWIGAKIGEALYIAFQKVGVNTFNLGMQFFPFLYYMRLMGAEGLRKINDLHGIDNSKWKKVGDSYKNGHWTITPNKESGFDVTHKNTFSNKTTFIGNYATVANAQSEISGTYGKLPEWLINALDPNKRQTFVFDPKPKSPGKIESQYDLNTRERFNVQMRALVGTITVPLLLSLMYDIDYDKETGRPILVRNDEFKLRVNGNMVNSFEKSKLVEKGLQPRSVQIKTGKVWRTPLDLRGTPLEPMFYGLYAADDMQYSNFTEAGGVLSPNNEFGYYTTIAKLVHASLQLAGNDVFFKDFSDTYSSLASLGFAYSNPLDQRQAASSYSAREKLIKKLREPFVRWAYGGNMWRSINMISGKDEIRYRSVAPGLQQWADSFHGGTVFGAIGDLKDASIQAHTAKWLTSDWMQSTGIPQFMFGLNGKFEDNFIPFVSSTGIPEKVYPNVYGNWSFLAPKRNLEEENGYDTWITSHKDVFEGYTYPPLNTFINGLTVNEENRQLRANILKLESDLVKLYFDNNKGIAAKIEEIPSSFSAPGYFKDNEPIKTKHRIRFNNNLRDKAYQAAIVLSIMKLMAENKDNNSADALGTNLGTMPENKNPYGGDGVLELKYVLSDKSSFNSGDDKWVKAEPKPDTEPFGSMDEPLNLEVNTSKLSVDLSSIGYEQGVTINTNISTDKLKDIFRVTTINVPIKGKDGIIRYEKRTGVALNAQNLLVHY